MRSIGRRKEDIQIRQELTERISVNMNILDMIEEMEDTIEQL